MQFAIGYSNVTFSRVLDFSSELFSPLVQVKNQSATMKNTAVKTDTSTSQIDGTRIEKAESIIVTKRRSLQPLNLPTHALKQPISRVSDIQLSKAVRQIGKCKTNARRGDAADRVGQERERPVAALMNKMTKVPFLK